MDKNLFRIPFKPRQGERRPAAEVRRIAVLGASRGAGCSFACGLLARELSGRGLVTLAELGSPYFYAAMGMERRFVTRPFAFYSAIINNGGALKTVCNMEEGINWALKAQKEPDSAEPLAVLRCFMNIPGDIIVFDCGGLEKQTAKSIMEEADSAVVVIDPMPSRLFEGFELLEELRLRIPKLICVVNKMNGGVHRGELKRFLGSGDYIALPLLDGSLLYRAEFSCMLPADMPEVRAAVEEPLRQLARRLL